MTLHSEPKDVRGTVKDIKRVLFNWKNVLFPFDRKKEMIGKIYTYANLLVNHSFYSTIELLEIKF